MRVSVEVKWEKFPFMRLAFSFKVTVIHDSPVGFYKDTNFIIFFKNATKREMVVLGG